MREFVYELMKYMDWIYLVEFSFDGVFLVIFDCNGGLYVWEGMIGCEYLMFNVYLVVVMDFSWWIDLNVLVLVSEDGSVCLWEMENGG